VGVLRHRRTGCSLSRSITPASNLRILSLVAAVAAVVLAAAPANAQDHLSQHLRVAAERNWYVRVSGDSSRLAEGRVRLNPSHLLRIGNAPVVIDEIRRVERRVDVGGGWKVGTFLGAGSGAAFGYGLSGLCELNCSGEGLKGALIFGGIGAILGGVFGQIIFPAEHRWRTTWP